MRNRYLGIFTVSLAFLAPALAKAAPTASFVETVDNEYNRYKVAGATGGDMDAAKNAAATEAIMFAAKQLTGSDEEKNSIDAHKLALITRMQQHSRKGRVLKTAFEAGMPSIEILIDVNVKELRRALETDGLIKKATALAEAVGNPTILVVPEGYDPAHSFSPEQTFVIDRVASFFTTRKYDMVDATAIKMRNGKVAGVEAVAGVITDPIAEIAALTGADIYVTFNVGLTAQVKASASLKAYDTSTAKLLASSTGESRQYPSGTAPMDVIREAVTDTIPKVFEDISGYWHEDSVKGRKYVVSITGNFSDREKAKAIRKSLESAGCEVKFDVKTQQKLGGTIRSKKGPEDVEDAIDDAIKEAGFPKPQMTMSNRALFVFSAQ